MQIYILFLGNKASKNRFWFNYTIIFNSLIYNEKIRKNKNVKLTISKFSLKYDLIQNKTYIFAVVINIID